MVVRVPRTVLVVDDEPQIREVLRAYLVTAGFAVVEAATGEDALRLSLSPSPPDLVLLDVGLPDIDGFEVLRRLRSQSDVYVLVITARSEEVDRIVGLTVGADDYIIKPFSPREVVARVQAAFRRPRGLPADPAADVVRIAQVLIDPSRREVRVAGALVTLTALEFDVLHAMAEAPGRVFSRAQLLEKVWGYDFYGDERVVDVHIRNIRKALGDDAVTPSIIGTVRGVGYKCVDDTA